MEKELICKQCGAPRDIGIEILVEGYVDNVIRLDC